METLKHKSYIGVLLGLEETVLFIDEIIQQLENHCGKLGNKSKVDMPIRQQVKSEESSSAGWIAGIIGGAVVAFIKIISAIFKDSDSGIISGLFSAFGTFLSGMFIGAIAGVVLGLIVNVIAKGKLNQDAQKEADSVYYYRLSEYHSILKADQERVDIENKEKSYIYEQINRLKDKRKETIDFADKIYKYNIISSKYWHDISALSYFSQYYIKPLDRSSVEEAAEAYEKAYLDYENDKMHGLIVVSPQNIVSASDYSIRKQRDLFKIMKSAHSVISSVVMETIKEARLQNKSREDTSVYRFIQERAEVERIYSAIIETVLN